MVIYLVNIWLYIWLIMVNDDGWWWLTIIWLVVWFQPHPSEKYDGVRQLGWWHSQLKGKTCSKPPNHQPVNEWLNEWVNEWDSFWVDRPRRWIDIRIDDFMISFCGNINHAGQPWHIWSTDDTTCLVAKNDYLKIFNNDVVPISRN